MTVEDSQLVEESKTCSMVRPGQRLKEMREQVNLSVEEVAARLCLRATIIEAVERDDYSQLAGNVFARGYLRAYARLLKADADEIIDVFNALNAEDDNVERKLWQSHTPPARKENPVRWLIFLIVLCSLILVAMWWFSHRGLRTSAAVGQEAITTPSKSTRKEAVLPPPLPKQEKTALHSLPASGGFSLPLPEGDRVLSGANA